MNKVWLLTLPAILSGLQGCSTAGALDVPVEEMSPSVSLQVVKLDPELEWTSSTLSVHGEVELFLQGQVVLRITKSPPFLPVWYEQSPDLIHWVPRRVPLEELLIELENTYSVYDLYFETLPDLQEREVKHQFFRVNY